jgi:hypothetical protein
MGFFYWYEIFLFFAANWLTFFCFWKISDAIDSSQLDPERKLLSSNNSTLLSNFIKSCAEGHLLDPVFMLLLAKTHEHAVGSVVCQSIRDNRPEWVSIIIIIWILLSIKTTYRALAAKARLIFKVF